MALKPVRSTDASYAPVVLRMDKGTGNISTIEAPTAAAASEVYLKTKSKEGPFSDIDIEEITRYIINDDLKSIIERDITEINTCFNYGANKSTLLICGSIIEIFLYQFLSQSPDEAKGYFNDLKRQSNPKLIDLEIDRWFLGDMLTTAEHLGLIDSQFSRKAREITDYRNIIHPTYEVRENVSQIENLAKISIGSVSILM
jgi:hypothetical protein